MLDLKSYLSQRCQFIDAALDRFIPTIETPPSTIHKAMRHSIFA
eukprot:gene3574-4453_t